MKGKTDIEYYHIVKNALPKHIKACDEEAIKAKIKAALDSEDDYINCVLTYFNVALRDDDLKDVKEIFSKIFYTDLEKSDPIFISILAMHLVGLRDLILREATNSHDDPSFKFLQMVYMLSKNNRPLLIIGETGTSKQLLCRAIHLISDQRGGPFIEINCSAISEPLMESELFGHEKGAFTGATKLKKGQFELSHKGTFFLDEIGKMPERLQTKLLKVIEDKVYYRVGGDVIINIEDVRIVAAMKPNEKIIEDLAHRFNLTLAIEMPTLNERLRATGRPIIDMTFENVVRENEHEESGIRLSESAYDKLMSLKYPGNYRELEGLLLKGIYSAIIEKRKEIVPEDFLTKEHGDNNSDANMYNHIPLQDIVDYANQVRSAIITNKMIATIKDGHDIKNAYLKSGLPEKSYQNFRNKVQRITGKSIGEFKTMAT